MRGIITRSCLEASPAISVTMDATLDSPMRFMSPRTCRVAFAASAAAFASDSDAPEV